MEQGLVDIHKKARELSKKFGTLSPYNISCGTLIAIIEEIDEPEAAKEIAAKMYARLKRDDLPLTPYQEGTPDAELLAEYEKLMS